MSAYTASTPTKDSTYTRITGGTLLADGTQAATEGGTVFGAGYTEWETYSITFPFPSTGYRPKSFTGPVAFVDPVNFPAGQSGTGLQTRTGPGYDIGFPFTFNSETFDRVGVSGQGWISFGKSADGASAVSVYTATAASGLNLPLSSTQVAEGTYKRNRVVAYGVQGGSYGDGNSLLPYVFQSGYSSWPGASLRIQTIGTAPNRVCVVQWENYAVTVSSLDPQYFRMLDFQIRLYETSNKVEVRFGDCLRGTNNGYSQIGLGGKNGGAAGAASLDYKGWKTNSGSWPTAWDGTYTTRQPLPDPNPFVSATDPRGTISSSSTQTPDALSFVWAPPACPQQASALAVSNIGLNGATLSWSGTGTFDWVVSPTNNPSDVNAITGTTSGNTANVTGLSQGTTYYAFVRTNCAPDFSAWSTNVSFVTFFSLNCGTTWVAGGTTDPNLSGDGKFFKYTYTICPANPGEKATIDFTAWSAPMWTQQQYNALFIYDGGSSAAPLIPGPGTGVSCSGNCPSGWASSWSVPAGGWMNDTKPPTVTSTAANGCLTVVWYSYGYNSWANTGWSANITCAAPPTCFAPTSRAVTSTAVHTASFSWNAGASPAVEYRVVASGGTPASPVVASGTSSTGSATTAAVLTANTPYTVFFRGLCDGGNDPSAWSDPGVNFRTKPGCGAPYDLYPSTAYAAYPTPVDSTVVLCPDNAGDAVTLTLTQFSFGGGGNGLVGLFVHDGDNVGAPLFSSGLPAKTSGANTLAAGAYWGDTYRFPGFSGGAAPGPFTSTAPNGCLTLHFIAKASSTYDQGMKANVTCAPAPACSTPNNVAFSAIGGTEVTVNWGNTSAPCIIEYGPVGFVPGTGATAGTNGTVVSGVTSPAHLTGLSATTVYDVYVRQVCTGPVYSANSFRARFNTSMDCSLAQVITCGQAVADDNAPDAYTSGSTAYNGASYTGASSCFSDVSYGTGTERLYRFTATEAGTHAILAGISDNAGTYDKASYVMTSVANGCAASAFTCIGTVNTNAGGTLTFNVPAAGDYFIMSEASAAVHKRPFTLACPGVPSCASAPTYPANGVTLAVNSTPIVFTWPAVFGATSYDVYFQGNLVANTPTNSINGGSGYTTANIATLFGLGVDITWRAVPKNSYGTPSCPTNWTFRVGGNGSTYAVPLTEGVSYNGSNQAANGYTNTNSTMWGNDSWFKFTASDCADSAEVHFCLPASATSSTYMYLVVRKASDLNGTPVYNPGGANGLQVAPNTCMQIVAFDYDWYYAHYMDPDYEDHYIISSTAFPVVHGETYYLIADGYGTNYNFGMGYTEITNSTDTDGDGTPDCSDACPENPDMVEEGVCGCDAVVDTDNDGIADCIDMCPLLAGEVGSPCDPGPGFANGVIDENCACIGEPLDCEGVPNGSALPGTACNDGNANTENDVYGVDCVCAGTPIPPCTGNQAVVVIRTDANGGQTTWQIQDAFAFTVASGGPYTGQDNTVINTNVCLPTTFGNCYSFYLFDSFGDGLCCANGEGYWELRTTAGALLLRDRFEATPDGHQSPAVAPVHANYLAHEFCLPAGPSNIMPDECGVFTNTLQSKVYSKSIPGVSQYQFEFTEPDGGFRRRIAVPRNWVKFSEMQTVPLVPGVTYFARVRVDQGAVGFADDHFGTGCEMGLSPNAAGCTGLIDDTDLPTHSCGVTKRFGASDKIWARPLVGATAYKFRFVNSGEGFVRQIERPSYICLLSWTDLPLQVGTTYDVQVNAFVNGVWTGFCGSTCQVTIVGPGSSRPEQRVTLAEQGRLELWPNPNAGDRVFVTMDGLDETLQYVQVDIFDLAGQKAMATTVPVANGTLNTVLDLKGALNTGAYLVRFTAGERTFTQRMIVQ